MTDLYTNIGWNSNPSFLEIYSVSPTGRGNDKLWLLSVKEVYELLGGEEKIENNHLVDYFDWHEKVLNNIEWTSRYWLRSFVDDMVAYSVGCGIGYGCYGLDVDIYEASLRPAFNIDLSKL